MIDKLIDGFEPLGDAASNELDRRLLFEIAGVTLFENEFKEDNSSDFNSDTESLSGSQDRAPSSVSP